MNVLVSATLSTVTFRVPEWGNATIIEASWTAIGLVGVAATLYALRHIMQDRRALELPVTEEDTASRLAARLIWSSHRRRETLRLLQNAIIVGIGVWAMTQSSIVHPSVATVTTLIITGFFTVVVAITVLQSIQDGRVRREITDLLR